jgi:hypothetical protein
MKKMEIFVRMRCKMENSNHNYFLQIYREVFHVISVALNVIEPSLNIRITWNLTQRFHGFVNLSIKGTRLKAINVTLARK